MPIFEIERLIASLHDLYDAIPSHPTRWKHAHLIVSFAAACCQAASTRLFIVAPATTAHVRNLTTLLRHSSYHAPGSTYVRRPGDLLIVCYVIPTRSA